MRMNPINNNSRSYYIKRTKEEERGRGILTRPSKGIPLGVKVALESFVGTHHKGRERGCDPIGPSKEWSNSQERERDLPATRRHPPHKGRELQLLGCLQGPHVKAERERERHFLSTMQRRGKFFAFKCEPLSRILE